MSGASAVVAYAGELTPAALRSGNREPQCDGWLWETVAVHSGWKLEMFSKPELEWRELNVGLGSFLTM